MRLRFGQQTDTRPVRHHGKLSERAVGNYIAKYATKTLTAPGLPDRPVRTQVDINVLRCPRHYKAMMLAAWQLSPADCNPADRYGRWAHMLDRGPVATNLPKVGEYLAYWLAEVIKPDHAPKTYERYEMFVRLHISPYLGGKRLDKLAPRDIRTWLNQLREACQCCTQGKDARRPESKRRCCAIGRCCRQRLSPRSLKDARDTLRAALGHAVNEDELLSRNTASMVRIATPRTRKVRA